MRAQTGEPSSTGETSAGSHTSLLAHLPRWHRRAWVASAALATLSVVIVLRSTVFRPQAAAAPLAGAAAISPDRAPAQPPAAARQQPPARAADVRAPALITLTIDSDPPGAVVFERGNAQPLGVTPVRLTRAAGLEPLSYRLSRTGYGEGVLQVVPDADKVRSVSLAPLPKAEPGGARRSVGRKVRGALPIDPFQP
jgi:hypothetical protein